MNESNYISTDAANDELLQSAHPALSPKIGEGSMSMKTLVQQHLAGIFKPINDHITDLQVQTQDLRDALARAEIREAELRVWLARHDEDVIAHLQRLGSLDRSIEVLQDELVDVRLKHDTLDSAHSSTRILADSLVPRIDINESSIEALRVKVDSNTVRITEVEKFENGISRLDTALGNLKESHVALQNRHLSICQGHQQVLQNAGDVQDRLQQLAQTFDNQKTETAHAILALNDRAFDAEKCAVDIRDELQSLQNLQQKMDDNVSDVLKNVGMIEQNFQIIKGTAEKEASDLKGVKDELAKAKEAQEDVKQEAFTIADRIVNIETGLSQVTKGHAEETEKSAQTRTFVQELARRVNSNSVAITKHKENIFLLDERQACTERQMPLLDSRATALENLGEALQSRIEENNAGLAVLGAFKDDAAMKMDLHGALIERGKAHREQLQGGLGEAKEEIKGLGTDLTATSADLNQVSRHVRLAHEYFDGLGKGLHDLHQHASAGDGKCGMLKSPPSTPISQLPPKKPSMLPGLPNKGI